MAAIAAAARDANPDVLVYVDAVQSVPHMAVDVTTLGCDLLVARQLVELGNRLRALKDIDLEEVASTRLLVYAAKLMQAGTPALEACRAALVESLTDDEETAAALMEIVAISFGD